MRGGGSGPSRVLITADAVGGVWTYALELARALAPADVQFTLAVLGPEPSREQRREVKKLRNVDMVCFNGKLEWMERPWADVDRRSAQLLRLAVKVRPDLVHLNDYASGELDFKAPALLVAHSCVCSWWEAVKGGSAPRRFNEYRRRVGSGLSCVDAVVAPSAALLKSLSKLYGPLRAPSVIPNAVARVRRTRTARQPVILAAGRLWDDAKNLQLVLEEAPQLPWPVRIAGEWPQDVAAPANVQPLGRLSLRAMSEAMSRASIFVHAARYEPFGLAPLEAATLGCALILGDIPSLREIWGDAAIYIHPEDGAGLRSAVATLADDPRRLAHWAGRAERQARRYSPARFGAAYLELYRRLGAEAAMPTRMPAVLAAARRG